MTLSEIIIRLILISGFLIAIVVIAHILRQRRSPAGTISWLLVIILLPYLGIPLYFLFGGRKTKKIVDSKSNIHLYSSEIIPVSEAHVLDKLLRTYNIPGASAGNNVSLCQTGEDGYNQLIKLIDEAKTSIFLLTFILAEDKVGKEVVKRIAKRAAEGITVRVLLDGLGSMKTKKKFIKPIIESGGETTFFIPVIHSPFHGRSNLRNHRKMLVADEKKVMAGGTNIAEEYIGPVPIEGRWKDLSFLLEGPAVAHYTNIFASDWKFATGKSFELSTEKISPAGNSVVQIVPSGPDVPGDPMYDAVLTSAYSARKRLWIVTPYFVPDQSLAQALILAAHRGIDLRILVPEKSNHKLTDLARGTYLRDIQEAGGEIFLFPGMVHAKILIVDNELASVGSANMDMRSLFLNYEVSMFTYSKKDIQETEVWIKKLMEKSKKGVPKISEFRNVCEGIVRMSAPLL